MRVKCIRITLTRFFPNPATQAPKRPGARPPKRPDIQTPSLPGIPAPAPPDPSRVTRGVLERSGGRLTRRMTLCLEPELARRLVRYCAGVERELSDVTGDAVRAFLDGQGAR